MSTPRRLVQPPLSSPVPASLLQSAVSAAFHASSLHSLNVLLPLEMLSLSHSSTFIWLHLLSPESPSTLLLCPLLCSHSILISRENFLKHAQGKQSSDPGFKSLLLLCIFDKEL